MALNQSFKVRDFRNKGWFMVDNKIIDVYAKKLGITTTLIYLFLCKCADKEQIAFPSQEYIAEALGMHRVTVNRHIKKLLKWNLIKIEKIRNHKGKFLHNTYYLIDKSQWKKKTSKDIRVTPELHGTHVTPELSPVYHQSYTNNTHINNTHTLYRGNSFKRTSLKAITEEDLLYIAEYYQVPVSFVKSKFDDLVNYCESKGKRYKDYLAALRKFVKQDAIKVMDKNDRHKAIDARNL